MDRTEIKITRTYSLDPVVVAWVTQKAARLTMKGNGERSSDSKVVNAIIKAAMENESRIEDEANLKSKVLPRVKKSNGAKS